MRNGVREKLGQDSLAKGGGTRVALIINPDTGDYNVSEVEIVVSRYVATACDGFNIYIVNGSARTLKIDVYAWLQNLSGCFTWLEDSPSMKPVGLAYGGSRLWLIGARGLHYYDLEKSSWSSYSQQPPYALQGLGNRLGYYAGKLYHVRAGGTRELWIIDVGS